MVKINKVPVKDKARQFSVENLLATIQGQVITLGSIFIGAVGVAILKHFGVADFNELSMLAGTAVGNMAINIVREYLRTDR